MEMKDPSLRPILNQAAGYIVFPSVGEGGLIVGGASGNGVIYRHGQRAGLAKLTQAEVGAVAGGQSYSELVIVQVPSDAAEGRVGLVQVRRRGVGGGIESRGSGPDAVRPAGRGHLCGFAKRRHGERIRGRPGNSPRVLTD